MIANNLSHSTFTSHTVHSHTWATHNWSNNYKGKPSCLLRSRGLSWCTCGFVPEGLLCFVTCVYSPEIFVCI